MSPHFIPWNQPVALAALDWLLRDWEGGTLDLSDTAIVVPTTQASRTIREGLAARTSDRGGAVLSPLMVTPEALIAWALEGTRDLADPADTLLAWMAVLENLPLEENAALFPVAPVASDAAWAQSVAVDLLKVRRQVEEGGRTLAEAARRLGPEHPEAQRWAELASVEGATQQRLAALGLRDLCASRLAAARRPRLPRGICRVVVLAVPDPIHLVVMVLESLLAQGLTIDVVIHAAPAEAVHFDDWGRPVTAHWGKRVIDIPDEEIHLLPQPEDEASCLLHRLMAAPDRTLAIGSGDPEVSHPLRLQATDARLLIFDPDGTSIMQHELFWLITLWQEFMQSEGFDIASQLVRIPEIAEAISPRNQHALLKDWDRFQQLHIPRTLHDAATIIWATGPTPDEDGKPSVGAYVKLAVTWLQQSLANVGSKHDGSAFVDWLESLYHEKHFATAAERTGFVTAMDHWVGTMETVHMAAARAHQFMDLQRQLAMTIQLLKDVRLYDENEANEPAIYGWLELPWQTEPDLIIAGMNEGMVPDSIQGDSWLPDSIRAALDLKTNATRLARDSYLLTSLRESRRAGGRLTLTAARQTSTGDPLKPSRLLLRCDEKHLPQRALQLFPKEDLDSPCEQPATWHRAWRLRVPAPPREAKVFQRMSVTMFSDYLACPFRFYLKHVLGMQPYDAAKDELDPRDFGSLIHDTIQALHEDDGMKESADVSAITRFVHEKVKELAQRTYGANFGVPVQIQLESARGRLSAFARIHAAERAAGWRVDRVEVNFPNLPGFKDPVQIDGVEIRGRIDLIERHIETDAIRILDYKTASSPKAPREHHAHDLSRVRKEINLPEWQIFEIDSKPHSWLNLQLPLYAHIVGQIYGAREIGVGYFHLPKAVSGTRVEMWHGLTMAQIDHAYRCAKAVVGAIRQAIFWPPSSSVTYDDFATLTFRGMDATFDASLLEKYRELLASEKKS